MANVDFTSPAWDETDEGGNITIAAAKVSWVGLAPRSELSHVSDSATDQGVSLAGDFTFKFEYQYSNLVDNPLLIVGGAFEVAETQQSQIDNSRDAVNFDQFQDDFRLRVRENGATINSDSALALTSGTTYFITLDYVVATKTATLEIHTGAHHPGGSHVDLLTATGSAGVTLAYIMALATRDDDSSSGTIDGFIQNLDLGAVVGITIPIMTYHYKQAGGL